MRQVADLVRHCVWIACLAVWLVPTGAGAVPVTFGFTGVVTDVDDLVAAEFSVGEQVVGSYTFDSAAADSDPDPTLGSYAITALTVTFGGDYSVTEGSDVTLSVHDGPPQNDFYLLYADLPTAPQVAGLDANTLSFSLIDSDSTLFASDALPLAPPDFSEFEIILASLIFFDLPVNQVVNFQVDSLFVIPEPSTALLLGGGLLSLGAARRWPRRRGARRKRSRDGQ